MVTMDSMFVLYIADNPTKTELCPLYHYDEFSISKKTPESHQIHWFQTRKKLNYSEIKVSIKEQNMFILVGRSDR